MLLKVYFRYIDKIYTGFADTSSSSRFLSILNFQHNDINFTTEKIKKL